MKKIMAVVAGVIVASMAYADYWNVDWCIYDAFSPKASGSGEDALTPALLTDYSVTWSLVYGDAVQVNPSTGELIEGTYTLIDQTSAAAGSTGLQWTDPVDGGITASFDSTLYALSSSTRYLGNAPAATEDGYTLYQHILIDDGVLAYYWLSDPVSNVNPTTDLSNPVKDLGAGVEIGTMATTDANAYWTPVPEPATMSLLGLGALAMVLRRKIRK